MPLRNAIPSARAAILFLLPTLTLVAQTAPDPKAKIPALEQQAQTYLQQQKPQLAIPLLNEIVSLDPDNVTAQGNLGVLLFFQGDYPRAIPPMKRALGMQPELWKIEALLGIAEKRTGDPTAAQRDLERAFPNLDDKKIQVQTGLELIELDSAAAQLEKALSVAIELQQIAPQDSQVLLASYELSHQIMDQSLLSLIMVAPDSAEAHMVMASELARQGDHANAIAQYREALRLNPMLPGAHYELAEQLRTSSDGALNAQAEQEYKAAIGANQNDELAWRQLGATMVSKGDFKTAEQDYRRALALQPKDSDAKTGLAIALINLNQTDEAISLLESALKDDPSNMVAHYRLSILYRRAGRIADSAREMNTFHHYQEVKDKLSKVFKNLAMPTGPM